MFVTELDWLLPLHPLASVPGRAIDLRNNPERCQQNKDGTKDSGSRQGVGAVMKDLGHCRSSANKIAVWVNAPCRNRGFGLHVKTFAIRFSRADFTEHTALRTEKRSYAKLWSCKASTLTDGQDFSTYLEGSGPVVVLRLLFHFVNDLSRSVR